MNWRENFRMLSYRSSYAPTIIYFISLSFSFPKVRQPTQVPVTLVRNDGIIYATGLTFTYT